MIFDNAQRRHELSPKTFEVPTMMELRARVSTGMYVKVIGGPDPDNLERFWVLVTALPEDDWVSGECANDLLYDLTQVGEALTFRLENICSYYDPELEAAKGEK